MSRSSPTLCLDGVEEGELVVVEGLKGGVPEGRHGQGLQVQQLCGRRVLLRKDQVAERHGQLGLTGWGGGGRREGQKGGMRAERHLECLDW